MPMALAGYAVQPLSIRKPHPDCTTSSCGSFKLFPDKRDTEAILAAIDNKSSGPTLIWWGFCYSTFYLKAGGMPEGALLYENLILS